MNYKTMTEKEFNFYLRKIVLQLKSIVVNKEYGIYQKQFSVFPEAAKYNIVNHIDKAAPPHAFFTKNQGIV